MTDEIKKFGGVFGVDLAQSIDLPGHKFVKAKADGKRLDGHPLLQIREPSPSPQAIDLNELRQWGELVTTPSGPTMGQLREAFVANEREHQEIQFAKHWNAACQSIVTVPAAVVEDWKERITLLQREVASQGLNMTAVISHPDRKPAELYGRPLKWEPPVEPVGPTGDTISLCLSTATMAQLDTALEAIMKEVGGRHRVRPGMSIKASLDVMESLMDPRRHPFPPIITVSQHLAAEHAEQELRVLLEEAEERLAAKPAHHVVFHKPEVADIGPDGELKVIINIPEGDE
ncbi:MAG: hypothetical protein ACRC8R_12080 [Aeromonas hydrophila]